MTAIGGHQSAQSVTDVWLTPPWLLQKLGQFDLDPCACTDRPWDTARNHLTVADNGLTADWDGEVFMNGPYSDLEPWLAKMAQHGRGVSLMFARTETRMLHQHVWPEADAVFMIEGRLHFHAPAAPDPLHTDAHDWVDWPLSKGKKPMQVCGKCGVCKSNGGAPSLLSIHGADAVERVAYAGIPGSMIHLKLNAFIAGFAAIGSWVDEVRKVMERADRPMTVAQLYKALAGSPKARGNLNWKAKVRQTLQRGPFDPKGNGVWELDLQAEAAVNG